MRRSTFIFASNALAIARDERMCGARATWTIGANCGALDPLLTRALGRATPFLRRQVGSRLRLKRTPELAFEYDESIAGQDRIEQLLNEIKTAPAPPDDDE